MEKPKVIIIGSGIAGSAAAARLALAGCEVAVFEKNFFIGGRCSLIHHNGYRFDQGPSLLLLPKLFEETFDDLGTSLEEEGVKIRQCLPENYIIHFGDHEKFRMSSDLTVMKREIERYEGKDGYEGYLKFLAESHQHYELSVEHVLHKNYASLFDMLRWSFLKSVFVLHPFESLYSRASKYFRSERMRRVFTFASMYMGMSPFDAPGTYSLLQYSELNEGIWYPIGGFYKVPEALLNVAKKHGAQVSTSSPVKRIMLSSNHQSVVGVELESGKQVQADIVLNTSDLIYCYNNLLPPTNYARNLTKKPVSCSSISFYWCMDRIVPELGIHNIFLAEHYRESFDAIFDRHEMPEEPSFYLNVPSRIDPSAAPPQKDAIVVLVPVGHLSTKLQSAADCLEIVNKARKLVLQCINKRLGLKEDFANWR